MFTDWEWMADTQIVYLLGMPVFAVFYLIGKWQQKK